jgi:hypothetical protein
MEKSDKIIKNLVRRNERNERAAGRIENTLANIENQIELHISQKPHPPPRIRVRT